LDARRGARVERVSYDAAAATATLDAIATNARTSSRALAADVARRMTAKVAL